MNAAGGDVGVRSLANTARDARASRDKKRTDLMGALDLILDVAYHDGTARDLAVAAEAYTLVGFHDAAISVTHASHDAVQERVRQARRGRPRRLLRADARGMVAALSVLIDEGFIDCSRAWARNNQRWLDRGGYDLRDSDAVCPSALTQVESRVGGGK